MTGRREANDADLERLATWAAMWAFGFGTLFLIGSTIDLVNCLLGGPLGLSNSCPALFVH